MVHQMVGHLVKRGVEMHDTFRKSGGSQHHGKQPENPIEKLPNALMALVVVTFFAMMIVVLLVRSAATQPYTQHGQHANLEID